MARAAGVSVSRLHALFREELDASPACLAAGTPPRQGPRMAGLDRCPDRRDRAAGRLFGAERADAGAAQGHRDDAGGLPAPAPPGDETAGELVNARERVKTIPGESRDHAGSEDFFMLVRNHWLGIGASILAGAFWGLVFLTPELTRGFTPIQLSAGRYLAYGLVAAALLAPSWRRVLPMLGWRDWRTLAWLSFAGNIIYYVFLANAVQLGGVAMTSLIIGLLPVTVTLAGRRDADAAPMLRLLPSLALGIAGLVCISWQSLSTPAARFDAGRAAWPAVRGGRAGVVDPVRGR
jgi:hypothetical protein